MKAYRLFATAQPLVALLALITSAQAAITDLATTPLSGALQDDVLPNILFVLDDSDSMSWNWLPDWANPSDPNNVPQQLREQRTSNAGFNGIAYNPAVRYNPPSYFTAGGDPDGTKYPSQTSDPTAGWTAVIDNGYAPATAPKSDLTRNAFYYTTVAGEYCTDKTLRTCIEATNPVPAKDPVAATEVSDEQPATPAYAFAAPLRWCNSQDAALAAIPPVGACRATRTDTWYMFPRMPAPYTSKLTITADGSVNSIKIGGKEILSVTVPSGVDLAKRIADAINTCSFGIIKGSKCEVVGYRATWAGSDVTIAAPSADQVKDLTPVLDTTATITASKFGRGGDNQAPGDVRLTVITNDVTLPAKSPNRSDCTGTTCTYDEEMSNYANWWAYYHTRMQAMKTASSQSLSNIDKTRRVGYMSINNNAGSDFLNIDAFEKQQKKDWYDKLFAAVPTDTTPLRVALANAGYLYAGKYNNTTLNNVTVRDPVQYYCQKNVTILSTDGYWNKEAGKNLDGAEVGDQDSSQVIPTVKRPQLDGGGQQQYQTLSQILMIKTPLPNSQREIKTEQTQIKYYPRSKSTTYAWGSTAPQTSTRAKQLQVGTLQQLGFTRTVTQIQRSIDQGNTWKDTDQCVIHDSEGSVCRVVLPATTTISPTICGDEKKGEYILDTDNADTNRVTSGKTDIQCSSEASWNPVTKCADGSTCQYDWQPADLIKDCTAALTDANGKTTRTCFSDWVVAASGECPASDPSKRDCSYGGVWKQDDDCIPKAGESIPPVREGKICSAAWINFVLGPCLPGEGHSCGLGNSEIRDANACKPSSDINGETTCEPPPRLLKDWAPNGEPTDSCAAATSTDPSTGVITSYRCITPTESKKYVAKCDDAGKIADDMSRYVATECTTENKGPTAVEFCQDLDAQGCPADYLGIGFAQNKCWATTCTHEDRGATPNTLADVAQYYRITDLRTDARNNCTPADINKTSSVCGPLDGTKDVGQHMLTYTLGLGASGLMQYTDDYQKLLTKTNDKSDSASDDKSDFASVLFGTTANPADGTCSWQLSGPCNWPAPGINPETLSGWQTNIDDLWHAAVNGGGTYFSARDPSALAAGISSALADIGTKTGSLTGVTVTSPNLVDSGGNGLYEVSFEVGIWAGDVAKRTIKEVIVKDDKGNDIYTVEIVQDGGWSAEMQLRKKTAADRMIYTFDPDLKKLIEFKWDGLSEPQKGYLEAPYIDKLSQFCSVTGKCETPTDANDKSLLNYLRGDDTYEGTYYRQRSTKEGRRPLGDIVGSEVVYVAKPPWNYVDKQYAEFKAKDRTAMVYVGANDGMLHAFYAETKGKVEGGDEAWAYIPNLVFPRLYKLADKAYKHQYTVDGTPVMGDICAQDCASDDAKWKTILVGGLNGGGRGYYALDITDPVAPKALWEFSDDNLGYTYGNPVITKLKDGTWVVIFASGYNNVPDTEFTTGDGKGRLFILNANTGAPIAGINDTGTIITCVKTNDVCAQEVGSTDTPSGLARIAAWANFPDINNTAERVYGGDLLGNLWRFDINGDIGVIADPKVYDAQRLAMLTDPSGYPQPITEKPELGKVKNNSVVFIGTGRLLSGNDFKQNPFQKQSFYAIKDKLTDTDYGAPRSSEITKEDHTVAKDFTERTLATSQCDEKSGQSFCPYDDPHATVTDLARLDGESDKDYAARLMKIDIERKDTRQQEIGDAFGPYNDGWYIDLPGDGEQSNTDPSLQRGSIVFTTNIPLKEGGCVPKATSFRYFIDYRTGSAIEGTNGIIAVKIADSLATRAAVVVLTNDKLYGLTRTDQPAGTELAGIPIPPLPQPPRRVSWRELVTE